MARLARQPLISIILPVTDAQFPALYPPIKSIIEQFYQRWELCVACRRTSCARADLENLARGQSRIKLSIHDGAVDLSDLCKLAAQRANGDFITFVDGGDSLAPQALYMVAEEINARAEVNVIYTDADWIDDNGARSNPQFKPDWCPDLLLSRNYLGRLTVFRRALASSCGGIRSDFGSSFEYDLILRIIEQADPATIRHIPSVLYHHRLDRSVTEPERALLNTRSRQALQEHLARRRIAATVEPSATGMYHRVRRTLPSSPPSVSLIIPTRDHCQLLKATIDSILERTDYPAYEIVVVDNQSSHPDAVTYLDEISRQPRIRVLRYDHAFNYSAINNFAAAQCASPILGLLNNDLIVINRDWLTEMVSHALRPEVGAVGAMLYYPDDTIQHAGVIVGFGGTAVHCLAGVPRAASEYSSRTDVIQNYSAVTAACMLTRSAVFAELGGLNDVELPIAFNDVDYCLRLRQRGYLITWTPYAMLYHLESASRGNDRDPDKVERARAEERYLGTRWTKSLGTDPYYNPNLSNHRELFALSRKPRAPKPWLAPPAGKPEIERAQR
ncbi:MAG: hypothetical protein QOI12_2746 [Alphaproteobacteria bacterium]|nr:hypothetical protein [Alphaproteobacteria bacterium]